MYWQGLAFVSEGRLLEKDALIFPGDSKAAQFSAGKTVENKASSRAQRAEVQTLRARTETPDAASRSLIARAIAAEPGVSE
jgi:hypothetical protein